MKAYRDNIVLVGRFDLDPESAILALPDTAKDLNVSERPDHMGYGEVFHVGPGWISQPDALALRSITEHGKGDIVLFDLADMSANFREADGEKIVLPQKALRAVIIDGRPQSLFDFVITVQDKEVMQPRLSKFVIMPDSILSDGQRTDKVSDGNQRMVFERVVSVGKGRNYRVKARRDAGHDTKRIAYDPIKEGDLWVDRCDVPACNVGDVVAFSPSASVRFRRDGHFFRSTPWDEIHGSV